MNLYNSLGNTKDNSVNIILRGTYIIQHNYIYLFIITILNKYPALILPLGVLLVNTFLSFIQNIFSSFSLYLSLSKNKEEKRRKLEEKKKNQKF